MTKKFKIPAKKSAFNLYTVGMAKAMELHRNFFMRVYIERNRRGWSKAEMVEKLRQHGSTISVHYWTMLERCIPAPHKMIIYHIIAVFLDKETSDMMLPITYDEQVEYNNYFTINSSMTDHLNNRKKSAA